jgi:hypothetical protein
MRLTKVQKVYVEAQHSKLASVKSIAKDLELDVETVEKYIVKLNKKVESDEVAQPVKRVSKADRFARDKKYGVTSMTAAASELTDESRKKAPNTPYSHPGVRKIHED